jgi:predicted transcriptional regulator
VLATPIVHTALGTLQHCHLGIFTTSSRNMSDESDQVPEKIEFTQEMLLEMKRLGLPKPEGIPWADWNAPADLNYKHDLFIMLAAHGHTIVEIAAETGYTELTIKNVVSSTKGRQAIRKLQDKIFSKNTRKRLEAKTQRALDIVEEIMENEQENNKVRLTAATYMLDQGLGKAKQEVEHKGSLLAEFMHKLDTSSNLLEAQKPQDIPIDPLDTFVESIVETHVVGAKVGQEEQPE